MEEPPATEWERAYEASIEREHEANLRGEEVRLRVGRQIEAENMASPGAKHG